MLAAVEIRVHAPLYARDVNMHRAQTFRVLLFRLIYITLVILLPFQRASPFATFCIDILLDILAVIAKRYDEIKGQFLFTIVEFD